MPCFSKHKTGYFFAFTHCKQLLLSILLSAVLKATLNVSVDLKLEKLEPKAADESVISKVDSYSVFKCWWESLTFRLASRLLKTIHELLCAVGNQTNNETL